MRVFNKEISTKILLCASIFVNVVFMGTLYKAESYGHYIRSILEKHGIVQSNIKNRPDYWAIRGWNTTIEKLDYKCDILFFGHSQIEASDFRKYFPNKNIVTSGYPGDNVKGMILRVDQIKSLKPNKIFLMCGVNSLGMRDDVFKLKYDELINAIKKASPNSELYVFNILPECDGELGKTSQNSKIIKRNEFIKDYTSQKNIKMIDLYSIYADKDGNLFEEITYDGIHLTPNGYDRWANAIKPYVNDTRHSLPE